MDNFDSYNVLLVIAINIPVLLMTAFVLQGHFFFFLNHTYPKLLKGIVYHSFNKYIKQFSALIIIRKVSFGSLIK